TRGNPQNQRISASHSTRPTTDNGQRTKRRNLPMSAPEIYSPGLEGIVAGETAISTVTGGLRYRGYPVAELAEKSTFDEVAYLLLHGELPTRSQLSDFNQRLASAQKLPSVLSELLKMLPKDAVPMDVLRTGVSMLAHYE